MLYVLPRGDEGAMIHVKLSLSKLSFGTREREGRMDREPRLHVDRATLPRKHQGLRRAPAPPPNRTFSISTTSPSTVPWGASVPVASRATKAAPTPGQPRLAELKARPSCP